MYHSRRRTTPSGSPASPKSSAWVSRRSPGCSARSRFGSARTPSDDPDYIRARAIAAELGRNGYSVITGGGPGMMEAANRGAQDVGATSIGCNIKLPHEQKPNEYQDISLVFEHFYARKVMFVRYAQAFVVMPGGFGTMDEMFESLTLSQTGTISTIPWRWSDGSTGAA